MRRDCYTKDEADYEVRTRLSLERIQRSYRAAAVRALPWIKNLTGKTVVIKYGGAAMVDEQLRRDVMSDIVLLKIIGMRPVIVHGGGKAINEALSHYDIPVEFKNGQRVTTPATMDIVREVLGGKVNQELVAALNHHGNLAVGVSGSDAGTLIAEPLDPELGRVGKVTHVNTDYIERLLDSEYIPLSPRSRRGGRWLLQRQRRYRRWCRCGSAPRAQGDFLDRRRRPVQGL